MHLSGCPEPFCLHRTSGGSTAGFLSASADSYMYRQLLSLSCAQWGWHTVSPETRSGPGSMYPSTQNWRPELWIHVLRYKQNDCAIYCPKHWWKESRSNNYAKTKTINGVCPKQTRTEAHPKRRTCCWSRAWVQSGVTAGSPHKKQEVYWVAFSLYKLSCFYPFKKKKKRKTTF